MKTRKSDFQPQLPPHMAPFSPSPPPPHPGRWEADSASARLLLPAVSLPPRGETSQAEWGGSRACGHPKPGRSAKATRARAETSCQVMPLSPADTSVLCCHMLPLHRAACPPAHCLAPLPCSPCSFLSFSNLPLSLPFFYPFFLLCLCCPLKCPIPC